MRYVYPCSIVRDEEEEIATGRECYVVTFPDVRGANTGGWSLEEALDRAEDALIAALGAHFMLGGVIPLPSPISEGYRPVAVPPLVAAKLALYNAMREQGLTIVDLAARLDMTEKAVRKLLNPDHDSHISQVENALKAVGRLLVVEDVKVG